MKKLLLITTTLCLGIYSAQSQTWNINQQRVNLEFSDIKFLNSTQGFVFGDSSVAGVFITGVALRTNDGGQTWATLPYGNSSYRTTKAFVLNASEIFSAGRGPGGNTGAFFKSTDGGQTWGSAIAFNERLNNVCFINSNNGWVMGKNGLLSKTSNGGLTWNQQAVTPEDIFSMRFFNSTQGVMVCGGAEIYITSDAGQNWSLVPSGVTEDLISVAINNSSAWICGTGGTLLYSANFGQTWQPQTAAVNIDFNDISFPDGSNGYTAGLAGLLNQTFNAGTAWQNQNSNCVYEITAISVPDINHGWFCNANGEIYSFAASTGVNNFYSATADFNIYPNPATSIITLSGACLTNACTIALSDLSGRILLTENIQAQTSAVKINCTKVPEGMYFIQVKNHNQTISKKITVCNKNK